MRYRLTMSYKIGVFDSGIGGEALAQALRVAFPTDEIIVASDVTHLPYGTKTAQAIRSLTEAAIQPLLTLPCDVIVLACNTATAHAIDYLREHYPTTPFVGIEPMIKQAAALSQSRVVGICATPATLTSSRYKRLKQIYGASLRILEPDCRNWAQMIEANTINYREIVSVIEALLSTQADVIVLGCTHYHWIKETIEQLSAPRATVLEPSNAIARRVAVVLEQSQSAKTASLKRRPRSL